jgi:general secretion pathway protein F/type IV pilus assembly protein PilC
MPLYRYDALSREGKKTVGVINADSYEVAKELLHRQKVYVTKLHSYQEKQKSLQISRQILIAFTRDLSQLLKAGLPLYESLLAIEEKYKSHQAHPLFLDLCDKVKQGTLFSEALKAYPKTFDQIYISMVASAEETGTLPAVFCQLEKLISRQHQLKKQLVSAMIYPLFLLSFCFIVIIALFFFLIPSMQQLFEGRSLHPMTQAVVSMSQFLQEQGILLGSILGVGVLGSLLFFKSSTGKITLQKIFLKIPILNKMITQAVLARFCRALSVMLGSSVALIEALQLSKKTMNHVSFEEIITRAEEKIMQGRKLSEELSKSHLIPSLVIRMLAISEEAGNASEMLQNIADIYEEELEKSLTRLTAMLQPVILLFLAVVVGVVILSILLPLTDVGSFLNT